MHLTDTGADTGIPQESTQQQTEDIFAEYQQNIFKHTDRMFAVLMTLQWFGGIAAALWFSPSTWAGTNSETHIHVWAAIFIGGTISVFPVGLALFYPGKTYTRYVIAIAQMLMSSLLIHLTGGRLETHFHIFGSLAFLSFYRDWRVLVPATLVVAADHILRGSFWPESVYGVLTVDHWRWVEHAGWVIFEDVFLLISIKRGMNEMWDMAKTTAEVRSMNDGLENRVLKRTVQLETINHDLENQVAERKLTEEALRESEAKFRDLFDNAPIAYHELDTEGRFTRINHTEELLLGYTSEELKGRHPWEFIVEKVSRDATAAKLAGKIPLEPVERTFIRKDGTHLPVINEDRLIFDADGKVTGIRSTIQDITIRKRQETERQAITEIVQGAITTSNLDELFDIVQQAIARLMFAENCFIALHDPVADTLHFEFWKDEVDPVPPPRPVGTGFSSHVLRTGKPLLLDRETVKQMCESGEIEKSGSDSASWLGVPLQLHSRMIGVLAVQHYEKADVYSQRDLEFLTTIGGHLALAVERKQTEAKLKLFNEKLQQSNRELQDFAYVASHDLQEPLRKVQAFSDRLKTKYAEKLQGDGLDYLERMRNAAHRMQLLIQDLLTFSRVSTKAQPFVPVNLENITRDVLSDLEVKIEESGATVEFANLPVLDADPLQMRQLIQNLVGNALKFKRKDVAPVINISGNIGEQQAHTNGADGNCRITVTDNGIGFDEKYVDKIFAVFQRLHGRTEYEGSGVGLAICRKIAERHNGNITAHSSPDNGATFIITLPHKQTLMEVTNGSI